MIKKVKPVEYERVDNCFNCRFVQATEHKTHECHRMPPAMVLWAIDNEKPVTMQAWPTYPEVTAKDWCGEHKIENEFSFPKDKGKR